MRAARLGRRPPASGGAAGQDVEALGLGLAAGERSRRYHSMSVRPAVAKASSTAAGSWNTKSRSIGWPHSSVWWRTSSPMWTAMASQPPGRRALASRAIAGRSSEPARCTSEYQAAMAAQPGAGGRAGSAVRSATSKRQLGEAAAGLGDHAGRQVEAGHLGARGGQVEPDLARPAAGVGDRAAVGQLGQALEEPPVERLGVELVDQLVGVGRRRRRRRTPPPWRRGPRPAGEDRRRDRPTGPRGRRRGAWAQPRSTGPSRWIQRLSCWPGSRSSSCTRGRPRPAMAARHASTSARSREGVEALGPGLQLARRLRSAQEQHGEQRPARRVEPELLVEHLAVLHRPGAAAGVDHPGQARGP